MFQMYVPNVLSVFRHMLQVFYLDIVYVSHISYKCFILMLHIFAIVFKCFVCVSDVCCKCFNYLEHMLQAFYLDVAKKILVLHMLQYDPSTATACCSG
jgi:hypothetical protein